MSEGELLDLIRRERDVRVLKRLLFIRFRYMGDHVSMASGKVGVSMMTGYRWQDRWNRHGYPGLIPRKAPGASPKLDDEQRELLMSLLVERDDWTTREVRDLVLEEFDVEYSFKQVWCILKSFMMYHGKPRTRDYRKPEDAAGILKKA